MGLLPLLSVMVIVIAILELLELFICDCHFDCGCEMRMLRF